MHSYLKKIDTKTLGNRNDVTPLFSDPKCFDELIKDLVEPFLRSGIDCVACIDALGFILGTAVGRRLGVGIIPIRKGGKLPVNVDRVEFVDYSQQNKQLEIRKDAFSTNTRVLIVDEWIETGAQVNAAISLIEKQGANIVGIASINMDVNDNTIAIQEKYNVHTVWKDA